MDLNGFVYYEPNLKTRKQNTPTITIYSKGGVSFNTVTYEILGRPEYVNIMYHRAKKLIFIRKAYTAQGVEIQVKPTKGSILMLRKDISDIIFNEITNWDRHEHAYKCEGKYDNSINGVIFNLNTCEILDKRTIKKK